jgi:hypothetical protein
VDAVPSVLSLTHKKMKKTRTLETCIEEMYLKRGFRPSSNLVKDFNGVLLADFHNILNRWKN